MLFPKRMKDLTILVHKDYTQKVVDSLQDGGVVEIDSVDRDEDVKELIEEKNIPEIITDFTDYEMRLSSIIDIFERIEEEGETSIKEFLNPPEPEKIEREKKPLDDLFDEVDNLLEENGKEIKELNSELTEIKDKIKDLKEKEKALKIIIDIDIELSSLGESTFSVLRLGKTKNPTKLKSALEELESAFFSKTGKTEEEYLVLTGAYLGEKEEYERALREGDFRPLKLEELKGDPKEALARVKRGLKKLRERRDSLVDDLREYKEDWEKKYQVLREELNIYRDKKEIVQNFGSTDTTSVIKAWAEEDDVEKVEDVISDCAKGHAEIVDEEPVDPDEVPISLENPKPIKPFELLTKMFAPPRYDEVDPTIIVGPAFVLFFGLMLGDFIYGLILAVGAIVMIKGPGKVEEGIKNFGWILFATGLSTIFFGLIQGGYMGPGRDDYHNLIGRFGIETPALLETLEGDGPLILLIISLVIGITYINIGLVLQLIQHIKRKNYKRIILENTSWWLLQPAAFILIAPMMVEDFTFTSTVNYAAYALGAVGLILLALRAKGLSFFELTGFLGDFLSFSRILALGLATAGIGLTVNVITDLVAGADVGMLIVWPLLAIGTIVALYGHIKKKSNKMTGVGGALIILGAMGFADPSYPFFVLALLVFFAGHMINLALQGLGSFVHSLRLQYVEFFGYFFEGGGKEFEPFKFERKHTKLKTKEEMTK
ncbi:MAG: V-type ATP synthase subunit I [Candidatus Thermoplasmatota archaeon]|nr:V-type ATP synthase subunit I [Candidatus Thermoplasmatota archaeon]